MAAGLSEDGSRVLVLEAGAPTARAFGGRDHRDYFTQISGKTELSVPEVSGKVLNLAANSAKIFILKLDERKQ